MGHQVRAKFRCLRVTTDYSGQISLELRPVQQKGANPKENAEFWSYTPNGESHLVFFKKAEFDGVALQVGNYYYIDMECVELDDNKLWSLQYRTLQSDDSAEVYLSRQESYNYNDRPVGFLNGYIKMGLEAKAKGAIEAFRRPGSKWKVTITLAELSDNEP